MKKCMFLLVALATIGLTTYFSLLPLNGNSQADISNTYFTSITPAGFTFSIWGLIYLSWILLGIFLCFRKKKKQVPLEFTSAVGLTALWLIPWHFEYIGMSLVLMLVILWLLMQAFFQKTYIPSIQYTLELFLGWILVATLANFHSTLVAYDIYFAPLVLTAFSLLIGTSINLYFIVARKSYIPSFVFIWALYGIMRGQDTISTQNIALMSIFLIVCTAILSSQKILKKMILRK